MNVFDKLLYIYDYIRPLLDIGILAFIFFKVYEFISKTNSMQIIKALVVIGVFYVVAVLLKLSTLLWLINIIVPGLVIAIVVIFQPEIRKLFLRLGQSNWSKFGSRLENTSIEEILEAAEWLAKEKRGMLVVFERQSQLETSTLVRLDTILNADISKELLQTIFATDTPLHDGACLVKDGKLVAANCYINSLSEDYSIKQSFGTRHRAALGLCEASDAVALIVSEETGRLSLAYGGELHYNLTLDEVKMI
ncbi:MAG: TIGR00159 family protein, partial [Treponema bryantii]|nr:TIGR00159 family protein [Treponema bryantii]